MERPELSTIISGETGRATLQLIQAASLCILLRPPSDWTKLTEPARAPALLKSTNFKVNLISKHLCKYVRMSN